MNTTLLIITGAVLNLISASFILNLGVVKRLLKEAISSKELLSVAEMKNMLNKLGLVTLGTILEVVGWSLIFLGLVLDSSS